jgi:hypothetical protein
MRAPPDASKLSLRPKPKGARVGYALFRLLLLGGVGVALTTASCGSPGFRCEGKPSKCSSLTPERCSEDLGCPAAATPLCVSVGYACALSQFDGTACEASNCERDENQSCRPVCAGASDAATCSRSGASCLWLDGACTTLCETLTDVVSCRAGPSCLWLACSGKPRACEEFSGDACPTWLGCDKVKTYAYSAQ